MIEMENHILDALGLGLYHKQFQESTFGQLCTSRSENDLNLEINQLTHLPQYISWPLECFYWIQTGEKSIYLFLYFSELPRSYLSHHERLKSTKYKKKKFWVRLGLFVCLSIHLFGRMFKKNGSHHLQCQQNKKIMKKKFPTFENIWRLDDKFPSKEEETEHDVCECNKRKINLGQIKSYWKYFCLDFFPEIRPGFLEYLLSGFLLAEIKPGFLE